MKKDQSFQQGSIYGKAYKNLTIINKTRTQIFALSFIFLISSQLSGQQKIVTLNTEMSGTHDVVGRDAVILSPGFHYNPSPIVGQPKNVLLTFFFDNISNALIVIDNTGYTSGIIYHPLSSKNIDEVFGGLVSQMETELGAEWQIEYSSDYEYQAYMTIQHNSDFSFNGNYSNSSITQEYVEANENCSFTARTNRSIIVESDYLEGSGIPDPDNRPLNTSLQVGSTAGSITTTALGGASYSIPVFCSPGTNGVQPSLSLQYNSQTGNGLLGWGWNLVGLSSISRMVKPYYIDQYIKAIEMVTNDEYAIDGNRLVLVTGTGTQGSDGSKYKTEQETFTETTIHGSSGNGSAWFEVKNLKDGSILEYGNASNAYIQNSEGTRLAWFLTKYKDVNGNYIKYNYLLDNTSGQTYLHSIQYTGNDNENLQPYNEIIIQYERRSDSSKIYQAGVEISNSLLISKIDINCEGNTVRTYTSGYSYSNSYSYLVEVKETAKNNAAFNSTIFKYDNTTQNSYSNSALTTTFKNKFVFADFNGDGKSDMAVIPDKTTYTSSDKIRIYFNQNGTDFQLVQEILINIYALKINSHRTEYFGHFNGGNAVDFNGDGLSDFYTVETIDFGYDPEYAGRPDQIHNLITIYLSNGSALTPQFSEYLQLNMSMFPADIDGDGRADEFRFTPDGDEYEIISAGGSVWSGHSNVGAYYTTNTGPIEFNGDGKDEVYSIEESGWLHIYGLNNSGQFTELISATPFEYDDYCLGDINGDGKTDIFGYKYGECKIFFSDGKGFNPVDFSPNEFYNNKEYFQIADFNSDGKSDIAQFKRSSIVETYNGLSVLKYYFMSPFYFYCYNGNSFNMESINVSLNQSNLVFNADFNGDGQNELYFRKQYGNWYIPYAINESLIYRVRPNDKSRLLSTVLNGLNNKTTISYGVLPQSSSYSKSSNNYIFPVRKLNLPLYLVENIQSFGSGESAPYSNTNYSYQDLALHLQGKGLFGFRQFSAEDLITQTKTVTTYGFETTYNGKRYFHIYPSNVKQYIASNLISETTNTPSLHSYDGGNRFFAYISLSTAIDIIKNITKEDSKTINSLGYITSIISKAKTSAGTVVAQVSETYSAHNNFGEPLNATITSTRGTESISRSKIFEYYANGLLKKETRLFGSSPSVESAYTYNVFGNLLTSSVTSGSEIRTNTFTYEPGYYRFVRTKTNPLGQTITYYNDPVTGNVLEEIDHTNLKTSYKFDGFGRITETKYPDGQIVYSSNGWSINAVGIGELYFTKSESANKPTVITYHDFLGRELRSKTQSFNGTFLVTDKVYDTKGRIDLSYMPYFEGNTADQYVDYSYDYIDRISSETAYPGAINTAYAYNNLVTTITKGGQIHRKEYDASGLLIKSTDPGGEPAGVITYSYNAEGKTKTITSPSGTTTIDYDNYGYQDKLHDIDAKTIDYDYNGFGELIKQTDAEGNISTMEYDDLGNILEKEWTSGETITYTYNPATGLLSNISSTNNTQQAFTYDSYYRVLTKTETIGNNIFTSSYTYDSYGNMTKEVLNNNVTVDYIYNGYGYLYQVKANSQLIWNANSMNRYGHIDNFTLGNNAITSILYDNYGFVDKKVTNMGSTSIQDWDYDFDAVHGNLDKRKGLNSTGGHPEENFTYDNLNRLLTYTVGSNSLSITYDQSGKGNISTKSDIGTYNYSSSLTHRLDSLTNLSGYESGLSDQGISYTKFNKIANLVQTSTSDTKQLAFTYGTSEERVKTIYTLNGNTIKTKYFALGSFEKEIAADNTVRDLYYISTPSGLTAVLEKINGQTNLYYIHTDILGSFDVITNSSGTVLERLSFDPWGRRRNPFDWASASVPFIFLFDRGFTGHEHLDNFGLINMNGRVYDPFLGLFLSLDNYVQAPEFTQNFNRYAYCLNNPLKYTDPDGEWVITALVTLANMYLNGAMANNFEFNPAKWDWRSIGTYTSMIKGGYTGWQMGSRLESKVNSFLYGKRFDRYSDMVINNFNRRFELKPNSTYAEGYTASLDGVYTPEFFMSLGPNEPFLTGISYEYHDDRLGKYDLRLQVYGSMYDDYNWIQTANWGETGWGIDPNDWRYHGGFYYNRSDIKVYGSRYKKPDADFFFQDAPNAEKFDAQLTLCGRRGESWYSVQTFDWGYEFDEIGIVKGYFHKASQVFELHRQNINNTLKFFNFNHFILP